MIRVLWPLCTCPAYILSFLQLSNHYLETVEVAETWTLPCHMYKENFLVNQGYVTLAIKYDQSSLTFIHTSSHIFFTLLQVSNQRREPFYAVHIRQTFLVNQGHVTLAIKFDQSSVTFMHMPSIYSLCCCKFQIIILKTVGEVEDTRTLLCHVYMAIFLSKSMGMQL